MRYIKKTGIVLGTISLLFQIASCKTETKRASRKITVGDFYDIKPSSPLDDPPSGIFSFARELIYEGLNTMNDHFVISDKLAKEIKTEGTNVFITLKDNAYFSDGHPLKSADVIFTINECANIKDNKICRVFDNIKGIKKIDEHSLVIILNKTFPTFSKYLSTLGIIPKHLFPNGVYKRETLIKKPTGCGPFMVGKVSEDELVLKRNPYYYSERPQIEKVIFKKINTKRKAWALLVAKEIDMIVYPSAAELELVKTIPYLKPYYSYSPFNYILMFNNENDLFKDTRVKQALNLAIGRAELVGKILSGMGVPSTGILPPWFSDLIGKGKDNLMYDPPKAKRLLLEAGFKDIDGDGLLEKGEFKLAFKVYAIKEYSDLLDTLLFVKKELLKIGVKIDIEPVDFSTFITKHLISKNFDAIFYPTPVKGDPDFLFDSWHSKGIKQGFNWANYSNSTVDRIFLMGRLETDENARETIYSRLQNEMQKDPPGIYLYWKKMGIVVNERFKNINTRSANIFTDIPNWQVN